jgi:hypothetical protein
MLFLSPPPFGGGPFPVNLMDKFIAIAGFLVLALSPSFIDFQQSPELRGQFFAYYGIGIFLIWFGLEGWAKQ